MRGLEGKNTSIWAKIYDKIRDQNDPPFRKPDEQGAFDTDGSLDGINYSDINSDLDDDKLLDADDRKYEAI